MIQKLEPGDMQARLLLGRKINEIIDVVNDLAIKVKDTDTAHEALLNRLPGGPGFG